MKKIEKMRYCLSEELEGAKKYAEKYIYYANSNPVWARTYAEMARQEVEHAKNLHKMYQEAIDDMRWVSDDDLDAWEECVDKMADTVAMVELMLSK